MYRVKDGSKVLNTDSPCYVDTFDRPCIVLHCPVEARLLRPTAIQGYVDLVEDAGRGSI